MLGQLRAQSATTATSLEGVLKMAVNGPLREGAEGGAEFLAIVDLLDQAGVRATSAGTAINNFQMGP